MKIRITLALLMLATVVNAQNARLENALLKNLAAIHEAKTTEEVQTATNAFERIADAEKTDWLSQYYAGYANIFTGMHQDDNAKKDEYYDRALGYINKADELSPDNSEVYVIKSWVLGMKIGVDPMNRGRTLGPESSALIAKAVELNPENPRAHFLRGQSALYTPEQYGGGKAIAKKYLETAVEKFKTFKPSSPAMPSWGEKQAQEALEKCN
jgi:tetratricopeptide (TPR) repeat protein